MSHIPASAMPHATPKHHDDAQAGEVAATATDRVDDAPHDPEEEAARLPDAGEVPGVLSPSPAFEPAPVPVTDTTTPTPTVYGTPTATPARGRRVGVALAAGAVALVAGLVAFGVPRLRVPAPPKRER